MFSVAANASRAASEPRSVFGTGLPAPRVAQKLRAEGVTVSVGAADARASDIGRERAVAVDAAGDPRVGERRQIRGGAALLRPDHPLPARSVQRSSPVAVGRGSAARSSTPCPPRVPAAGTATGFQPAVGPFARPDVSSVVGCPPASAYRPSSSAVACELASRCSEREETVPPCRGRGLVDLGAAGGSRADVGADDVGARQPHGSGVSGRGTEPQELRRRSRAAARAIRVASDHAAERKMRAL